MSYTFRLAPDLQNTSPLVLLDPTPWSALLIQRTNMTVKPIIRHLHAFVGPARPITRHIDGHASAVARFGVDSEQHSQLKHRSRLRSNLPAILLSGRLLLCRQEVLRMTGFNPARPDAQHQSAPTRRRFRTHLSVRNSPTLRISPLFYTVHGLYLRSDTTAPRPSITTGAQCTQIMGVRR